MQQTIMEYACKRDLQSHAQSGGDTWRHSLPYGRSRPKHALSEGLMALIEEKKSEANLLIELSQYSL